MKKIFSLCIIGASVLTGCNNSIQSNNQTKHPQASSPSFTQTNKINNSSDVKNLLKQRYGLPDNMEITYLKDANLYQVYVRGEIVYVTTNGNYLIPGHLISTLNNNDVTQEYLDNKNIIDVKKLPLNLAIKEIKGTGKNVIYVFTDPDCPYCHMFNSTIVPFLDNVTIYNFLMPLSSIHPNADSDSLKILCSKNPSDTLNKWLNVKPSDIDVMRDKILPNDILCKNGESSLNGLKTLANNLNINGTPTIFNSNGKPLKMTSPLEFKSKVESSN